MKKVLGLLMASLIVVSCSKDDNGPTVDMSKLTTGKWYYKSVKYGNASETAYVHECSANKDYVLFSTAGTFTEVGYDEACTVDTYTLNYVVSGKTVSVSEDGVVYTTTIKELTATKMVVEDKYDSDDNGTDDSTVTITFYNN